MYILNDLQYCQYMYILNDLQYCQYMYILNDLQYCQYMYILNDLQYCRVPKNVLPKNSQARISRFLNNMPG